MCEKVDYLPICILGKAAVCSIHTEKIQCQNILNVENGEDVTVYNRRMQDLCTQDAIPQLFPLDKGKQNQL